MNDLHNTKYVVFIDALGIRRALSLRRADIADKKISELGRIVNKVLQQHKNIYAHGSTDCFVLWTEKNAECFEIAVATSQIFQEYFDLNRTYSVNDIDESFLVRAGFSRGHARSDFKTIEKFSQAFLLGDGLARAYEAQATAPGMRIMISTESITELNYSATAKPKHLPLVPIYKCHDQDGNIESYEFQWPGTPEAALDRVDTSSNLFEISLSRLRKKQIPERVTLHYQHTLCSILRSVKDYPTLLQYCSWRHKRTKFDRYYAVIWANAWLRLLDILEEKDVTTKRHELRDKYIKVAGTRVAGIVSREIKRRNGWDIIKRVLLGI